MRARNITDRICRDFCDWLRTLENISEVVDEEILRDMFEIDFTADASRTMQVELRGDKVHAAAASSVSRAIRNARSSRLRHRTIAMS
jgi:hypothetical protein